MTSYWIAHTSAQKWLTEKVTNTISNYCISKSHTCHITYCLLQHVLQISDSANASGKQWHHSQTVGSATCISQGSVATVLNWGGKNTVNCVEFLPDVACPKLLKLPYAAWTYSKNKSGTFLWITIYMFDNVIFACVCPVFYHLYVSSGVLLPCNFVFIFDCLLLLYLYVIFSLMKQLVC